MPRFFVNPEQVNGDRIVVEGSDVNHISRVLRMKRGEELSVSDGAGMDYHCIIDSIEEDAVMLSVQSSWESYTELPVRITLFQGLPKADKMELIIQKTVELGVDEIVPVAMSRSIVKLDDKKAGKKTSRWQSISESAAKQAGRGIIPTIAEPMTYGNAIKYASQMDAILFPYENAKGITYTRETVDELKKMAAEITGDKPLRIGIFIGPEGGFADDEVDKAKAAGAKIVTLGKRILRTETAGMAMMSILMYELESEN